MSSLRRDRSRTGPVAGLLALSLVIAFLLAGQTQYAVRSHRKTVEAVLSSSAALAGEELVRRASNEVGYLGYMRILETLPGMLPVPPETALCVPPGIDAESRRALDLVRGAFVVEAGAARFVGQGPAPPVAAWLASRLAAPAAPGRRMPYTVSGGVVEGNPHLFVWSAGNAVPRVGFEVALGALGGALRRSLSSGPLLPTALAHGAVGNDALSISVLDLAGGRSFHAGGQGFPNEVSIPFGESYGGVLRGFSAVVSIDPAVASRLVPGGLPRSRLPFLLSLLSVSIALAVTAGLQVKRERDLARLRESFVAGVSHELRTPLAQIRLFAETLLLGRTRSSEEERRALVVIDREARRLSHLVANVLTFSQASRSAPRLARASLDLVRLASETLDGFAPLARVKDVTVSLDAKSGASELRVPADSGAVSQILVNLLDNAVKYGPAGQDVVVRLRARDGVARIEVEDRGPGVPFEERRRIFERFTRLPREEASGIQGAGIGLAVVRELAEAHAGRAFVEDSADGRGARFVVELPGATETAAGETQA